jgi:hypothetical protein
MTTKRLSDSRAINCSNAAAGGVGGKSERSNVKRRNLSLERRQVVEGHVRVCGLRQVEAEVVISVAGRVYHCEWGRGGTV